MFSTISGNLLSLEVSPEITIGEGFGTVLVQLDFETLEGEHLLRKQRHSLCGENQFSRVQQGFARLVEKLQIFGPC